jgi:hypothetical protein
MATEMGVSQQQISYDLKILQERWVKSGAANMDEAKSRELAKIDNLERTYWASWETTQKLIVLPDKTSIEAKNVPGDPRYLTGVQWCIERRAKLLGLDAPARTEGKLEVTDPYSEMIKKLRAERNIQQQPEPGE